MQSDKQYKNYEEKIIYHGHFTEWVVCADSNVWMTVNILYTKFDILYLIPLWFKCGNRDLFLFQK